MTRELRQGRRRYRPYPKYKDSGVEWLGAIPAHWEVRRWRYCCRITEGQVDPTAEPHCNRTLIAPNHIEPGTGRIIFTETAAEQGAISGKYLVAPGDIIYSKIRPSLNKICIADGDWLCSADMYPVRVVDPSLSTAYLIYFMLSEPFVRLMIDESMRVAMPKVNRETLSACAVVTPPSVEQDTIAEYLCRETAKIDALIEKKERLLELLQEKRTALITHAVTKGLDPDVPMKDSGSEFLPEIPGHWVVTRARYLCRDVADGPHFSPDYVDDGVMFISARNVKVDGWSFEDAKYIAREDYDEFCKRVIPERGDVLYTKGGTTGVARAVDFDGLFQVWVHIAVLKLLKDRVDPFWLAYTLNGRACYEQSQLYTRGATNNDLGLTRLINISLAVPPLEEQRRIVDELDRLTAQLNKLIGFVNDGIDRLREYRTALISAAVTGKIDVREELA